ncbi:hypothetical protein K504DRAFT_509350 [Pleomassaria siparia CBS 279.74]|uniref:Uncharacterized protein n=1 Tax=Pleomassaria siparia CBS 279.74 TaxID=1314801 RepID=A0A6G1KNF5_9PLEO|nr:hypothetical protein K504DRAFT_509350 [Pleomassaria siparia CBS 279.74]
MSDNATFTGWQKEPTTRGTFIIVSVPLACLFTCVWTAVHLNLPKPHEGDWLCWPQLFRRIKWFTIGVFLPEIIAWCAYRQYREAEKLDNFIQNTRHEKRREKRRKRDEDWVKYFRRIFFPKSDKPEVVEDGNPRCTQRKHHWTFIHSFYAVMGGFAVDISGLPENERFLPNGQTRVALTISGVAALFNKNPEFVPDIPRSYLDDKSKLGSFGKGMLVFELVLFFTQCIRRWRNHLGVSLFEINVLTHVFFALIACGLWWNKPLDVDRPVLIEDKKVHEAIALMCILNDFNIEKLSIQAQTVQEHQEIFFKIKDPRVRDHQTQNDNHPAQRGLEQHDEGQHDVEQHDEEQHDEEQPGDSTFGFKFKIDTKKSPLKEDPAFSNCCRLARSMLIGGKNYEILFRPHQWERFLLTRIPNWPKETQDLDQSKHVINDIHIPFFQSYFQFPVCQLVILAVAGLVYAGIHEKIRPKDHPSKALKNLSNVSTYGLFAISGLLFILIAPMWRFPQVYKPHPKPCRVALHVCLVLYILAKIAMLVGCCWSLNYLDPSIIKTGQPLPWM